MFGVLKEKYRKAIYDVLLAQKDDLKLEDIKLDVPFESGKGDIAMQFFSFAKLLRKSPRDIAVFVADELKKKISPDFLCGGISADNGYLNIYFDVNALCSKMLEKIISGDFGMSDSMKDEKIMVEFSCPNTNKPLHLGHMRNDALGSSISKLLKACSADVFKVNLVNDRGIHICKSMYAYRQFGEGKTPESENIKSDRFVADYYVAYNDYEKEHEQEAKNAISLMLQKWENGDAETRELWSLMRKWALDGINQTYSRTNISFDKTYFESELYKFGKEEVRKGLEKGVFHKSENGAVVVTIDDKEKVLLRADGTSIYMTQDIGTAIRRHEDYPYTSCVYVVGNEQIDHFKTLFAVLKMLGFSWSSKLYHLAYGMVNLPDGAKMKSREGTVVDADDLLNSLSSLSVLAMREEISDAEEQKNIADSVALAALNYFLLSVSPGKDMVFDPKKSLSFSGDTGPYLQYTAARINSILQKAGKIEPMKFKSLASDDEKMLVALVSYFTSCIEKSARTYDPSALCLYTYNLCKTFSHYYHDTPILKADGDVRNERVALAYMVVQVLRKSFDILGIPFLERM